MYTLLMLLGIVVAASAQFRLFSDVFDDNQGSLVICAKENNINDDVVSNLDNISSTDVNKAFVSCFISKFGMMDNSGTLISDPILSRLRASGREAEAMRYQSCVSNASVMKSNPMDTAFALYQCLIGQI